MQSETRRSTLTVRGFEINTIKSAWHLLFILILIVLTLFEVGQNQAAAQPAEKPPEAASRTAAATQSVVRARRHMVVSANPYATEAGRRILRSGGSAVDAAIAAQLVLGLVEPQSSGLGGGAFLVHWDASGRSIATYDGRETAPGAAKPDRFIQDGRILPFGTAVRSGLAVGVPGAVRMLELAHQRHGRLAWPELFKPAIELATSGFKVGERLSGLLQSEKPDRLSPGAQEYFFNRDGRPRVAGSPLANPAYAETLRLLADGGAKALHEGPIAEAIVAAVRTAARYPGDLTLADMAAYRAKARPPVCAPYRGHRVCSMGPPSSGGVAIAQTLMLLDGLDLGHQPKAAMAPAAMHLIAEAEKLAFADRNWYLADEDFVHVPKGLLDPTYIMERRKLINPVATLAKPYPGLPPDAKKQALGDDATIEREGTSHLSIVDADGNAVALTTTIEAGFGSGLWAAGFLLNNQLTDFSARPSGPDGRPAANRIEGGKRPRSSMAPVIVLDAKDDPVLIAGSPGGSRIIPYVVKVLVGVLDWQLNAQAAVNLPNFGSLGGGMEIEAPALTLANAFANPRAGHWGLRTAIALAPLGQRPTFAEMTSGVHIIVRRPDGSLEGGADPRREGTALGD